MLAAILSASIIQVSGGGGFVLFLRDTGTVCGIGYDGGGLVPNGKSGTQHDDFTDIALPRPATQIASASGSAYALLNDGTVVAWGSNIMGQLGDDTTKTPTAPVAVKGLTNIVQVSSGMQYAVALRKDGHVLVWGKRNGGVMGDGKDEGEVHTPQEVPGLDGVKEIAAGYHHVVALKTDGTVWAWGENGAGQIGIGSAGANVVHPVQVPGLADVVHVAAGFNAQGSSGALTSDGRVWVWGSNETGLLANGKRGSSPGDGAYPSPKAVPGVSAAAQLILGDGQAVVIHRDGKVTDWGHNGLGGLGNGKAGTYSLKPEKTKLSDIKSARGASMITLVVKADGSVLRSGGALGRSGPYSKPVKVFTPVDVPDAGN
ncbi:MAG TPA: hypothetical protein VGM90_29745 [Kofleriaceae bacterium]|jgi:alpha-tubulin suppressor-like RCC1 family protein